MSTRAAYRRMQRRWEMIDRVVARRMPVVPGVATDANGDAVQAIAAEGRRVLVGRGYRGPVTIIVVPPFLLPRTILRCGWGQPDTDEAVMGLWGRLAAANAIAFVTHQPPARLVLVVGGAA